MFGRRGEVVWEKQEFVSGEGGRRDYDAYQGVGLLVPFYLTNAIHTFGWGKHGDDARAIPLERDSQFALRVYMMDWGGPFLVLSGLGILPLACSGVNKIATFSCFAVLVLSGFMVLYALLTGNNKRHRDIRLILGKHEWGSSDPATWHRSLLKRVKPANKHGAESFSMLAEDFLGEKQVAEAMWAARLCVALEDEKEGEDLTNEIITHPSVRKRLEKIRKNPGGRNKAFGKVVSVSTWVSGELGSVIMEVDGGDIV